MFTDLRVVSLLVLAFRIPPHTGKARQTWKRCRGFTAFPSPTPSCWKSGRSSKRKPRTEIIGKLEGCVTVLSGLSFPPVQLSCACSALGFVLKSVLDFRFPDLEASRIHSVLRKHSESITVTEDRAGDPQRPVNSASELAEVDWEPILMGSLWRCRVWVWEISLAVSPGICQVTSGVCAVFSLLPSCLWLSSCRSYIWFFKIFSSIKWRLLGLAARSALCLLEINDLQWGSWQWWTGSSPRAFSHFPVFDHQVFSFVLSCCSHTSKEQNNKAQISALWGLLSHVTASQRWLDWWLSGRWLVLSC